MTDAPQSRESLLARHAAARRRRDAAPLGSAEFRAAADEVAEIEIAIAELEQPTEGPYSDAWAREATGMDARPKG